MVVGPAAEGRTCRSLPVVEPRSNGGNLMEVAMLHASTRRKQGGLPEQKIFVPALKFWLPAQGNPEEGQLF